MTDPDASSLRVSDAERDQTLRTLGEHAAVGRLTLDELEERSSRALAAKTRGELATLTGDLPQEAGQDRPAPAMAKKPVRWMVAIMSGSQRRGRFRAIGSINAIAIMGGDEIDLREAEIEGGELTLNLVAVMGGATIYIPDSVELASLQEHVAGQLGRPAGRLLMIVKSAHVYETERGYLRDVLEEYR